VASYEDKLPGVDETDYSRIDAYVHETLLAPQRPEGDAADFLGGIISAASEVAGLSIQCMKFSLCPSDAVNAGLAKAGINVNSYAGQDGRAAVTLAALIFPEAGVGAFRGAATGARGAVGGASRVAANGAPIGERLFTSRTVGVDSKLLGHSYARGESGLVNRTGSRLKFGWTSSGEFGGGWHLRLGAGRSRVNPNQSRFHWDFGSTHVPNSVANDLLDFIRGMNGL
jgi:hypothetical protein